MTMSRTFEGPMEWQYHDHGPLDPTSPFAQVVKNIPQDRFGTASQKASPFRFPQTHTRTHTSMTPQFQTPPSATSRFTPQLLPQHVAPPFRNPAFTTPRKPLDEALLSEASGLEDSPALTETSDYPNETPEADHKGGTELGGILSPSRIDKLSRYGRPDLSQHKRAAGKGEIRPPRDLVHSIRKRKRYNCDKDVSSSARKSYHILESDRWESDSDASVGTQSWRRTKRHTERGTFESLFHVLAKYPQAPDHVQRWMQLGANFLLISVLAYVGWSIVSTIRNDIFKANEIARLELISKMTECQTQYTMNDCAKKDRPALRTVCEEWYDCMMQNPESILRVKVTAKQVAEIINEFSEAIHIKAWGIIVGVVVVCASINVGASTGWVGHRSTHNPSVKAESPMRGSKKLHDVAPGYMLVPLRTPKTQPQDLIEEGERDEWSPWDTKSKSSAWISLRQGGRAGTGSCMKAVKQDASDRRN